MRTNPNPGTFNSLASGLYYGDNLYLLRERIPTGSVDLIYSDPPFSSNRNYFVLFKDRTGKASAAQEEAFTDTWSWDDQSLRWYNELLHDQDNHDLAVTIEALRRVLKETPMMAYLVAMAIRLVEIHRALKPTGSLYLHCDPTASHYLKVVLDVIFGPLNFRNEITWKRTSAHNDAKQGRKSYGNVADTILFYTKSGNYTFHTLHTTYDEEYVRTFYKHVETETGRRYRLSDLTAAKPGGDTKYEWAGPRGIPVRPYSNRSWAYSKDNMRKFEAEGRLVYSKTGMPSYKRYLDEMPGVALQNVWDDIRPTASNESLGYPTQKPLALLERIIAVSSNEGDIVMDCFCGCGTAVDAAQKLGRRWIGMDVTAVAIDIVRARMEQRHPELAGSIPIYGFPQDLESAQRMFEADPYGFQEWACIRIGAHPRRHTGGAKSGTIKKGADSGIDGWLGFEDLDGSSHRAVVQVKGGKVQVGQIRDFCHVVVREQATLGFFLCLGDAAHAVTKPMQAEAMQMGMWTSAGGRDYRRVQIITMAGLLEGKEEPRYPPQDKHRSLLGYKAAKEKTAGWQTAAEEMFDG